MSDEVQEKRNPFREWYERHKGDVSAKRKDRYASDPEFREKVKNNQREYRKSRPVPERQGPGRIKTVQGVKLMVYRIGETAELINRDEQTIRGWEEKKIIPRPTVPGVHRNYTDNQVALMKELAEIIDQNRYSHELLAEAIRVKSQYIHKNWKD